MKILLAIDDSTFSNAAVNEVAARPWPLGSVVKIISAVRLPFTPNEETRSLPDSEYSRIERAEMGRANAAITKASAHLSAGKANLAEIESAVIIGDAREMILDEAAREKADLIVLGSRGLGGFKRFLLGSVALGALTHAPCSVRIARGGAAQGGEAAMKILLAIDGSPYSLTAANEVARRPWPEGSSVKIIHVAERPPSLPQGEQALPGAVSTQLRNAASDAIDQARGQFTTGADAPLAVECEMAQGYPKTVILDEAGKWGADLIVLGSRGLNAVERFLLGSVSQAVATNAKCSVEVVRRPQHESAC